MSYVAPVRAVFVMRCTASSPADSGVSTKAISARVAHHEPPDVAFSGRTLRSLQAGVEVRLVEEARAVAPLPGFS
jgi:hypothetical protein